MTVRNSRSLVALFLSVILMLSFFTVNAFAAEEDSVSEQQSEGVTENGSEGSTTAATEDELETATETASGAETTTGTGEEGESNITELVVNLVIGGVIIVIAVVLIIKNRVKLGAFLRSVKNELHKIIWSPKEQTRKNFLVVIVICAAVAVLVGLLDFAFSKGIIGLASLFSR